MATRPLKLEFDGARGARLAARLDLPAGKIRAFALFAHCFTCSKDIPAARHIAGTLSMEGIAVLRFDFTGLGGSGGDFSSTGFSSNVEDLKRAADFLRQNYEAPQILIGHSLGGAAVLSVASDIPEVRAVVTIGAPSEADHVIHNFKGAVDLIRSEGKGEVDLAGRTFTIRSEFLDDLEEQSVRDKVSRLGKPLLVMHAPLDETVGIDNATNIFIAARHPKSFVSLDKADHLLTRSDDAAYAARVIAGWVSGYLDKPAATGSSELKAGVEVVETGQGKFQAMVVSGEHRLIADEPADYGGLDSGPSPYGYLSAALGACTVMTLRMYADRKGLSIDRIGTRVLHDKVHAVDCEDCADELKARGGKVDRFERLITLEGDLDEPTRTRMLEIADKCPVHRTLEAGAAVVTREVKPGT
ncbi:MAG: bifunctional alpha/beta hydrolase/OsmC family protein [Roseibium sp.]|uniref:bifunctional alpha/beta hydrolase/OsmC family protein n=1 Tax=Roseibium sp. TaxID=1936156 RepID=UPI0026177031|nr:bifunctional alpha/beta hydrolase/OsmC family protein [Roseibium sp.]MCV0425366.1 bifunctional alpha/beta hydrolase/OsmC family protein [Roseibium sp.]